MCKNFYIDIECPYCHDGEVDGWISPGDKFNVAGFQCKQAQLDDIKAAAGRRLTDEVEEEEMESEEDNEDDQNEEQYDEQLEEEKEIDEATGSHHSNDASDDHEDTRRYQQETSRDEIEESLSDSPSSRCNATTSKQIRTPEWVLAEQARVRARKQCRHKQGARGQDVAFLLGTDRKTPRRFARYCFPECELKYRLGVMHPSRSSRLGRERFRNMNTSLPAGLEAQVRGEDGDEIANSNEYEAHGESKKRRRSDSGSGDDDDEDEDDDDEGDVDWEDLPPGKRHKAVDATDESSAENRTDEADGEGPPDVDESFFYPAQKDGTGLSLRQMTLMRNHLTNKEFKKIKKSQRVTEELLWFCHELKKAGTLEIDASELKNAWRKKKRKQERRALKQERTGKSLRRARVRGSSSTTKTF